MKTMTAALAALCLGVSLAAGAAGQTPAPAALHVEQAWIRLLPGHLPSAGYFTLRNDTDTPVQLVGASSPAWRRVSLHESIGPGSMNHGSAGTGSMAAMGSMDHASAGMGSMVPVASVNVPPHDEVRFAPGGYHVMLSDGEKTLQPGQRVDITLHLGDGTHLDASFLVRPADAMGPR